MRDALYSANYWQLRYILLLTCSWYIMKSWHISSLRHLICHFTTAIYNTLVNLYFIFFNAEFCSRYVSFKNIANNLHLRTFLITKVLVFSSYHVIKTFWALCRSHGHGQWSVSWKFHFLSLNFRHSCIRWMANSALQQLCPKTRPLSFLDNQLPFEIPLHHLSKHFSVQIRDCLSIVILNLLHQWPV